MAPGKGRSVAQPAEQRPTFDRVLSRHGLRAERDEVLRSLDRSLADSFAHHQAAPPSAKRAALLARGGFRAADDAAVRTIATQAATDYTALVETALTTAEVAKLLRVSESRVRQLTGARRLAALSGKPRRYPRWQFTERGPVPHLDVVLPAAGPALDPLSLWRFFLTSDPDLVLDGEVVSPRDWLVAGADPDRVRELIADL